MILSFQENLVLQDMCENYVLPLVTAHHLFGDS